MVRDVEEGRSGCIAGVGARGGRAAIGSMIMDDIEVVVSLQ